MTPTKRRDYYLKNKERELELSRQWVSNNLDKVRANQAAYRIRRRDHIRKYNLEYIKKRRLEDPDFGKRWYRNNLELVRQQTKIRLRALKIEVMLQYGEVCACCGESKIEFLCLDHINNDGKQHRKELGNDALGNPFYRYLKRNGYPHKDRLQVLCLNCNGAKAYYGICPHQVGGPNVATAPI